jgi:ornithine cyclodeaminase/alanine dehydrogenase-like protein (mu-crystallin family)
VRAEELVAGLRETGGVPAHVALEILEEGEGGGLCERVQEADVIFTGVPSTSPLFPAEWLMSEKARGRGRYIAAIGSYRLDMQELDPELLREMATPSGLFQEMVWNGKVAVDSAEACLVEAGELVKAGIGREGMLEVGTTAEMRAGGSTEGLEEWLADGFVVYKSVGVGIMDIAIGSELLELAGEKGVGVRLDDF